MHLVQVHAPGTQPHPHRVMVRLVVLARGLPRAIRRGEPGKVVDLSPSAGFLLVALSTLAVGVVVLQHPTHGSDLALQARFYGRTSKMSLKQPTRRTDRGSLLRHRADAPVDLYPGAIRQARRGLRHAEHRGETVLARQDGWM